jgi:MFS transporter, DHA1 family, multidrug resistance protein
VSVIGIVIYCVGGFILLQCIYIYIAMAYPKYAASLFAGNAFCRSAFAFASLLYSRPLYQRLGAPKGVTLLGGLSVLGIVRILFLLFFFFFFLLPVVEIDQHPLDLDRYVPHLHLRCQAPIYV